MSYKHCNKCYVKFNEAQMVCCRNCKSHFDRKCAKKLCDEAGEWAIRPTKLAKWSCTECQAQPARVCCDVCKRTTRGGSGSFAACGKCGRHECRTCAGLSRRGLARQQRGRAPWLCVSCCESTKDVPASWDNDKIFAEAYVRFPTLWKPDSTETELRHAYGSLATSLGLALGPQSKTQLMQRCWHFERKCRTTLRRLAHRHRTTSEILRHTPVWLREVEQRRNFLPSILQTVWCPDEPEEVLHELARRIRTPQLGHALSWTQRMVTVVAARLGCPAPALMDVWTQTVRVALQKLQLLSLVGDDESLLPRESRPRPHEWLAADRALLHSHKRAEWLVGYLNSQLWLLHVLLLLRLVQQYRLEERHAPAELRARWVSAYRHYTGSGLTSSVIVLQRRWLELKIETRSAVRANARGRMRALLPHQALIARRYPDVVTKPLLSWNELRRRNLIVDVTQEDVKKFRDDVIPLPVADDDPILREAKNLETSEELPDAPTIKQESDAHRQQVVAQLQRDVVELRNLGQMQKLNLEPLIQDYEADLSEIAGENDEKPTDDSLRALEEIDPKIASTSIIFESDSDKEDKIKSPKTDANNDTDDDCQIVDWKIETCELSDDSDVVFKTEQSNVAVCFVSNKIKGEDDIEPKTEPNEMFVEDAIDPKLQMIPIVRLVRVDEQVPSAGSKRPLRDKVPDEVATEDKGSGTLEDAIEALHKDLIGYKIPDNDEPHNDSGEGEGKQETVKGERRERPRGYEGPLTGRVQDLSWLCTSISIALEKLPEEVLNNVKATTMSRRVWLPDIEQVRRDNKRLLVAQVAPLLHNTEGVAPPQRHSRALSTESSKSTITSKSSAPSTDDYGLLTQAPEDEESDCQQISEAQLQKVLNDLQERPLRAAWCCPARRQRAYNDARLRRALRLRRDAPPEHDLHGAKHRKECDCCCRHLLQQSPRSLAALQDVLAKSLEALMRRRGESPTSSDNSTDQRKRTLVHESSSSDEERLVMDVPQPKKTKRPSKKKKRRSLSDEGNKTTNAKKDEAKTTKKKQETKTSDDSEVERRKQEDYNEWMRQRSSHRRFFQPPGTKENTIIYMSKEKDKVIMKNIGSKENNSSRPDLRDHTYAVAQPSEAQATETASEADDTSTTNVAPSAGADANQIQMKLLAQYQPHSSRTSASTVENIAPNKNQHAAPKPPDLQANPQEAISSVTPCTKEHTSTQEIPETKPHSDNQLNLNRVTSEPSKRLAPQGVQVLGSTFIPLAQQPLMAPQSSNVFVSPQLVNPSPQDSVNPVNSLQTSYFMIYQQPAAPTAKTAPAVSIVPVTISMQPEGTQNLVPKETKSIFQENFRQKMVQNLTLLSGGGLLTEDEIQKQSEHSEDNSQSNGSRPASPRIFDELPEGPQILSMSDVSDEAPSSFRSAPSSSAPTRRPTAPGPPAIVPALPNAASFYPKVDLPVPLLIPLPTLAPAPVLPTISSVTSLASTLAPAPVLPTISSVTSLASTLAPAPVLPTISSVSSLASTLAPAPVLPTISSVSSLASTLAPAPVLPTISSVSSLASTLAPAPVLPTISSVTSLALTLAPAPVLPTISSVTSLASTLAPAPVLPTISSVTSLASTSTSVADDDDDDDCVITSPPVQKTIIIKPQKTQAMRGSGIRYIRPEWLYQELPQHISAFMGRDQPPFSLLRVNSELRLWTLPEGSLVLTDTAVACRNIRYFIINSKSLNRMVPVHFDKAATAEAPAGRIKVRAFAKMPAEDAPADHMTAEDKLFKRLANDPPIYAKVLTAMTDVMSAKLLAASGYSLLIYSPGADSLLAVHASRDAHTLYCEDSRAAQYIAHCFNCALDPSEKIWKVAKIIKPLLNAPFL